MTNPRGRPTMGGGAENKLGLILNFDDTDFATAGSEKT